jgi:hypothetical protein
METTYATPLSPQYAPSADLPTPSWAERQSIGQALDAYGTPRDILRGTLSDQEAAGTAAGFAGATAPGSIAGSVGRTISTRFPQAVRASDDAFTNHDMIINGDIAARDPALMAKNANLMRSYSNLSNAEASGSPQDVADAFTNHVKSNLLWLHDQVPPDIAARSARWYDGANAVAKSRADITGQPIESTAGVYAALSPQKDWFQNVSLGDRLMDIHQNQQDTPWSPQMTDVASRIYPKAQHQPALQSLAGKRLSDVSDPVERAMWIRTFDEANHPRNYPVMTPEGEFLGDVLTAKGQPASVAWGSNQQIANAMKAFESKGDLSAIGDAMGRQHKVRSFFNNLSDPNNPNGHTTIDTHAIAAGLMRPLSGADPEVEAGLGLGGGAADSSVLGVKGLYPFYADAYRRAAAERGILPREMRSITWEAVRGLFPPEFNLCRFADPRISPVGRRACDWLDCRSDRRSTHKHVPIGLTH